MLFVVLEGEPLTDVVALSIPGDGQEPDVVCGAGGGAEDADQASSVLPVCRLEPGGADQVSCSSKRNRP